MATLIASPITEPRIDWSDFEVTNRRIEAWAIALAENARGRGRIDPEIGRIVKFSIADGYAEYVVFGTRPLQLIHVPESYDISGAHMRGLTLSDVRALVEYDRHIESMFDAHEDYYANLPVGTIVHYDNGFGQFVRCERVEGPKGKRLRELALVGNWDDYDLPRRMPDGSIHFGYHAEGVIEGRQMEPNYGSIWERYDAKGREWSMRGLDNTDHLNEIGKARFAEQRYQAPFDPTTEPAIDLTPPPIEGEALAMAAYVQRMHLIRQAMGDEPQTLDEARAKYAEIRALVVPDYQLPEAATD
jgi:hypothetical protein